MNKQKYIYSIKIRKLHEEYVFDKQLHEISMI